MPKLTYTVELSSIEDLESALDYMQQLVETFEKIVGLSAFGFDTPFTTSHCELAAPIEPPHPKSVHSRRVNAPFDQHID